MSWARRQGDHGLRLQRLPWPTGCEGAVAVVAAPGAWSSPLPIQRYTQAEVVKLGKDRVMSSFQITGSVTSDLPELGLEPRAPDSSFGALQ